MHSKNKLYITIQKFGLSKIFFFYVFEENVKTSKAVFIWSKLQWKQ